MNSMNQQTQQNAAASEELSATAEEMSNQAQHLMVLMSFFVVAQPTAAQQGENRQADHYLFADQSTHKPRAVNSNVRYDRKAAPQPIDNFDTF
jgi:hypothetical protein